MKTMISLPEPEIISFASQADWRSWLEKNYQKTEGIWLRIYKKDSGIPTVTYAQALDEALCFGWIDGQKQKGDATSWLQRFTPRRAKSVWSKVNTEHIARLTAAGLMHPAGLAVVETAKADGRWEAAYASQRTITIPEDFQRALNDNPKAKTFFAGLSKSSQYSFLYRIHNAKKPETRSRKINEFITMLNQGQKFSSNF